VLETGSLRRHLTELVVVFVGVALAFAVENLREDLNERKVGAQYLEGFRQDLLADAAMLREQLEMRRAQLEKALVVLEFFDGRAVEPGVFFEAYYTALPEITATPSRNTMDEVLNSGNLRLIQDASIRGALLDLYATYDQIAQLEAHMARDFDAYLYDTTFSMVRIQLQGPWEDTPASRRDVETLLGEVTIENGIRLMVANIGLPGGLLEVLARALSQVEHLLGTLPAE
jgi:hypothetical protein